MAERVLQKLELLDKQAKILMNRRIKKNKLQYVGTENALPLTFDYHSEFEEGSSTLQSASRTASKTMEDKSHLFFMSSRCVYFKIEPEPRKNDFEKLNLRSQFVPTNIKNQETQIEKNTRKSLESIGFLEDDVNKRRKYPPPTNDFSTKEKKPITSDPLSDHCSVRKNTLLPLCFEDELKNPNAKIVDISPAKTETSQVEQKDTNPIIFHDKKYIQMLLFTKNGLSAHLWQNEKLYPHKRTNFVLERNCAMLKSFIGNEVITFSEPQRTTHITFEKDKQATPLRVDQKTVKNTCDQPSKGRLWSRSYTISPTFSHFTKKCVGYLDKPVIREKSDKTHKFERMLSTVKLVHTHKFTASPIKDYSKPSEKILEVHKISDVTPLDDLLKLSKDD
ncbi:uncharacterized protein C1orf141 homolog [Marmota marmota marmota]|uniref:uncharacterized protein C1orf141 homolog n=1 Tax=Marmota marmota marmota TaxID=9994 RepID=UPI0020933E1C|nr:uncharacterized protein C1orf141 homolog [Marmota marmota marmota]